MSISVIRSGIEVVVMDSEKVDLSKYTLKLRKLYPLMRDLLNSTKLNEESDRYEIRTKHYCIQAYDSYESEIFITKRAIIDILHIESGVNVYPVEINQLLKIYNIDPEALFSYTPTGYSDFVYSLKKK